MILRLYLLHLLVPLLLVIDVLHALARGTAAHSDLLLAGLCALWLLIGLCAAFWTKDRARRLEKLTKPLLAFYVFLVCFLLLESGLQIVFGSVRPTIWRPGTHIVYQPDPQVTPGIVGTSHFTVNEIGLRGPSVPRQKPLYRIITVGGSTTLCLLLDDSKQWPQLLMDDLNAGQNRVPVWVGNAGVQGDTAVHHLSMLQVLPYAREANLVIFLPGINDLQTALTFEGASTQALLQRHADQFREHMVAGADSPYPLYHHLRLYRLVREAIDAVLERSSSIAHQDQLDIMALRKQRAAGHVVPLPDLSLGLREYQERLQRIGETCKQMKVRCLFLTQPSLWHVGLDAHEKALWIFGWVGPRNQPKGYASDADLARALDSYNQVALDNCRRFGFECFDLAAAVPKNTSFFYDDFHFNDSGARIVAHAVADYLLRQAAQPFAKVNNIDPGYIP